jgi:hypothetical protein
MDFAAFNAPLDVLVQAAVDLAHQTCPRCATRCDQKCNFAVHLRVSKHAKKQMEDSDCLTEDGTDVPLAEFEKLACCVLSLDNLKKASIRASYIGLHATLFGIIKHRELLPETAPGETYADAARRKLRERQMGYMEHLREVAKKIQPSDFLDFEETVPDQDLSDAHMWLNMARVSSKARSTQTRQIQSALAADVQEAPASWDDMVALLAYALDDNVDEDEDEDEDEDDLTALLLPLSPVGRGVKPTNEESEKAASQVRKDLADAMPGYEGWAPAAVPLLPRPYAPFWPAFGDAPSTPRR